MLPRAEALRLLLDGQVSAPPLALRVQDPAVHSKVDGADFSLTLTWKGQPKAFGGIYKPVSTPKNVQDALTQAKAYASKHPERYPLILVPYLSEESCRQLEEAEVSGMDFCGNLILFAEPWLVHRTGHPNLFPSGQAIKNIFEGKSALVGRALLTRPRYEQVSELRDGLVAKGTNISMGTVSKVLKSLEEQLIVSREDGITLLQPERLLHELAQHYKGVQARQIVTGKAELDTSFFESVKTNAEAHGVRFAGRSEDVYAVAPTSGLPTRIYVSRLGDWMDALPFQQTERFSNVEFVETNQDEVFFDLLQLNGFAWCSRVQIYLECINLGKREQETASSIKKDILKLLY